MPASPQAEAFGDGDEFMVRYRVDLSQYLQWRDESEPRRRP